METQAAGFRHTIHYYPDQIMNNVSANVLTTNIYPDVREAALKSATRFKEIITEGDSQKIESALSEFNFFTHYVELIQNAPQIFIEIFPSIVFIIDRLDIDNQRELVKQAFMSNHFDIVKILIQNNLSNYMLFVDDIITVVAVTKLKQDIINYLNALKITDAKGELIFPKWFSIQECHTLMRICIEQDDLEFAEIIHNILKKQDEPIDYEELIYWAKSLNSKFYDFLVKNNTTPKVIN